MKKLSVIVPVYNVEQYLAQCIESILGQTLQEIELILVDDGSTDGSGLICDHYAKADDRVKVFHQKNSGPIEARRHGLLESTCDYVTFADADDFVAPVAYISAVKSMEAGIDVIIFGKIVYHSEQEQQEKGCLQSEGIYCKEEIERIIWPNMIWNCEKRTFGVDPALWNKIMKRSLVLNVYQRAAGCNFHYGEDVAVIYPILACAKTLEIKAEAYYYHRQRERTAIAPYISDRQYFDKLYALYCFLRTEFQDNEMLLKQVEFFYMCSANLRRRMYGSDTENNRYLFPFDKVRLGERVVIYGAGTVGKNYVAQIHKLSYCDVVLWVDKNYDCYNTARVSPVETINTVIFDKIVIAILDPEVQDEVANNLVGMGIEPSQIVK